MINALIPAGNNVFVDSKRSRPGTNGIFKDLVKGPVGWHGKTKIAAKSGGHVSHKAVHGVSCVADSLAGVAGAINANQMCIRDRGSTIVTLKTSYLETLSVGKHTLAIVSETGTATTEFTIKAAAVTDDTQSPQTGDDSNIALWIAVLLAAGTALTGTAVYSRKRKYSK